MRKAVGFPDQCRSRNRRPWSAALTRISRIDRLRPLVASAYNPNGNPKTHNSITATIARGGNGGFIRRARHLFASNIDSQISAFAQTTATDIVAGDHAAGSLTKLRKPKGRQTWTNDVGRY